MITELKYGPQTPQIEKLISSGIKPDEGCPQPRTRMGVSA